jgi:hypothetical protein
MRVGPSQLHIRNFDGSSHKAILQMRIFTFEQQLSPKFSHKIKRDDEQEINLDSA